MVILGLNCSHNATACLLIDGHIIAAISEERLTRVKNQTGIPLKAITEVLKIGNLTINDVDYVALNTLEPRTHLNYATFEDEGLPWLKSSRKSLLGYLWKIKEILLINFPKSRYLYSTLLDFYYDNFIDPPLKKKLFNTITTQLNLPVDKIVMIEHHLTHILPAILVAQDYQHKPYLIFSLDSLGDKLCATVSIAKNGVIKRISSTLTGNSIGDLYTQTTAYLGMKMGEHEYKLMGLAPYSSPVYFNPLADRLKTLCWVNNDLTFETKIHSHLFYKLLPSLYLYQRFDSIAAAVQKVTEDLVCEWITKSIKKTKIQNVVLAGGVFMNVKLNQKILELNEVGSLAIMPSSGDESTAIGAALASHLQYSHHSDYRTLPPITNLYFGGEFTDDEINKELNKSKYKKYQVSKEKNINQKTAALLAAGEVVARCTGKMEWGARALGNRSILAHPSKLEVVNLINEQIKSRDFWMPFAPSILDSDASKYLQIKKPIQAPYMSITFDSTTEGKNKLKAAMHQYDFTVRPQIVYQDWNPEYFDLLQQFKKISGISSLLNTSFNLHGYPIVYTPEDALFVFENSNLQYLSMGSFLISKTAKKA